MVLGIRIVLGRPTYLDNSRQGHTALQAGAGCLASFLSSIISLFSIPRFETARYRLKYCLKGPLNPKPTSPPKSRLSCRRLEYPYRKEQVVFRISLCSKRYPRHPSPICTHPMFPE